MKKYIDKDALVAEINRVLNSYDPNQITSGRYALNELRNFLDTLEVKTDEDSSFEKFKSLPHINKDLNKTLKYFGYAPNLYYFDGSWNVDWLYCEEDDSVKDFTGDTAEEAIDKAYNWFHLTFCND